MIIKHGQQPSKSKLSQGFRPDGIKGHTFEVLKIDKGGDWALMARLAAGGLKPSAVANRKKASNNSILCVCRSNEDATTTQELPNNNHGCMRCSKSIS